MLREIRVKIYINVNIKKIGKLGTFKRKKKKLKLVKLETFNKKNV